MIQLKIKKEINLNLNLEMCCAAGMMRKKFKKVGCYNLSAIGTVRNMLLG